MRTEAIKVSANEPEPYTSAQGTDMFPGMFQDKANAVKAQLAKHWPEPGNRCMCHLVDNTCCNWDPGFEYDFEDIWNQVDQITDWDSSIAKTAQFNNSQDRNTNQLLTHEQGRQLLGYHRAVGGRKRRAMTLRTTGEGLATTAALI